MRVEIDADLQELIPGYLDSIKVELEPVKDVSDLEKCRAVAHKLAGNAGGYGFTDLGQLGRDLEGLCKESNSDGAKAKLAEIFSYLDSVEVVYV